jgi:Kdo2-lipid IVA lauroyltransferase/acyltransferase
MLPSRRAADFAVYLVVRLLVCVLQSLSLRAGLALADALAWLAYRLDRRHRLVALDNFAHAYPELDEAGRDAAVRAVYRHCCRLVVEMLHMPRRLHVERWPHYLDWPESGRLLNALTSGRPLLLVTGHLGNWELGNFLLGLLGVRSSAIARRLDNPHLHRFVKRFRVRTGQTILDKHADYERIQAVLAEGGTLGVLADQDAGARGPFVPFFGRPASTTKAVALLSLEHRAPILVLGVQKVAEPFRYRLTVEDTIHPEEYDARPDAVVAITARFTAALERMIRRHPEQYFWLHRRWKHQPKARAARRAA